MKVSVILPSYNGSKFIKKAIRSVLAQSFKDLEFLLIDDGSQDHTPEIIQEFSLKDERVRAVRLESHKGFQAALNWGLSLARGEYVARIDDDDLWIDEDKLQRQVEFLDSHPDHVLVTTAYIIVDEGGRELHRHLPPQTDAEIRKRLLWANVFIHSALMFRREPALTLGGYSYAKVHGDDYDLCLKLGTQGRMACLPTFAVKYTVRSGSVSSKNRIRQLINNILIIGHYRQHYSHYYFSLVRRCLELAAYGVLGISPYSKIKLRIFIYLRTRFPRLSSLLG